MSTRTLDDLRDLCKQNLTPLQDDLAMRLDKRKNNTEHVRARLTPTYRKTLDEAPAKVLEERIELINSAVNKLTNSRSAQEMQEALEALQQLNQKMTPYKALDNVLGMLFDMVEELSPKPRAGLPTPRPRGG